MLHYAVSLIEKQYCLQLQGRLDTLEDEGVTVLHKVGLPQLHYTA